MTSYTASIEWICDHAGVLRVHESPFGVVGDPYVWCCTLERDGDVVTLKGACADRRCRRPRRWAPRSASPASVSATGARTAATTASLTRF